MADDEYISPESAERALKDAALQKKAQAERTQKLTARDENRKYGTPVVKVTINPPHTAQSRGDQIAIKINAGSGAGGTGEIVDGNERFIVNNLGTLEWWRFQAVFESNV